MSDIKIGIGIVLFYPNIDILRKNIAVISPRNIVLINNTPDDNLLIPNVLILNNMKNLGVAKAYNQILSFFESKNFDYVITFDQDSRIPNNMLTEFKIATQNLEKIGALCPNLQYQDGVTLHKISSKNYEEKDTCISSGCMINIKAWRDVGGFDERFFIDFVDFDFCFSLIEKGYKIFEVKNVVMKHELGMLSPRYFFQKKIMVTHHTPIRKFYYARNAIICHIKHKEKYNFHALLKDIFHLFVKVLLFEENKIKKISAIIKGILAGRRFFYNATLFMER